MPMMLSAKRLKLVSKIKAHGLGFMAQSMENLSPHHSENGKAEATS